MTTTVPVIGKGEATVTGNGLGNVLIATVPLIGKGEGAEIVTGCEDGKVTGTGLEKDTGCVAWKNVPVTGTGVGIVTGTGLANETG